MVWLQVLFLLVVNCTLSNADGPQFVFPLSVNPSGPEADALRQAFEDAIVLARTIAVTFDPCDPVSRSRPLA